MKLSTRVALALTALAAASLAHANGAPTNIGMQNNGAIVTQEQGQGQTATGGAASAAGGTASSGGNALTLQSSTSLRYPVATAYAAPIYPTASCAKGASGGIQGTGLGLSIGGTEIDENCAKLERAKAAFGMGQGDIADEMMRLNFADYAAAAQNVADRKAGRALTHKGSFQPLPTAREVDASEPRDPIIRRRLGLPAL